MSTKYMIRWKSNVNGRAGRGTKEFNLEEGERLVEELNRDYPDIEHELMRARPTELEPAADAAVEEPNEQQEFQTDTPASRPLHALSFR